MKTKLLIIIVTLAISLAIPQTFGAYVEFENKKDRLIINNEHIVDFQLDWGSEDLPSGKITFDESINETILLQIPKNIPRTTNLDFGHFSLYAIQTDDSWIQIKETDSQCFYILEIPVNDSDYVEIVGASVAAGRWESITVHDEECNDAYNKLNTVNRSLFPLHGYHAWKTMSPLKQQLSDKIDWDDIICSNSEHVLTERTNGKIACVYQTTAEKFGWYIHYPNEWDVKSVFEIVKDDITFDVEYTIKEGIITNMMQSNESNSLLITIDSNNDGQVTFYIPHGIIDPIPKDSGDNWLFVLINGEEVESEQDIDDELNRTVSFTFNHPDPDIEIIASWWI